MRMIPHFNPMAKFDVEIAEVPPARPHTVVFWEHFGTSWRTKMCPMVVE
jgi:hypothetical protein